MLSAPCLLKCSLSKELNKNLQPLHDSDLFLLGWRSVLMSPISASLRAPPPINSMTPARDRDAFPIIQQKRTKKKYSRLRERKEKEEDRREKGEIKVKTVEHQWTCCCDKPQLSTCTGSAITHRTPLPPVIS